MTRMTRIVVAGLPHHVTQRSNHRAVMFFEAGDDAPYRDLLAAETRKAQRRDLGRDADAQSCASVNKLDFVPGFSHVPEYLEGLSMAGMVRVSSTEFGKEVGRYQDMALGHPVVVTRNGRDRTVMISVEEYERLKRRDRHVFASGELPEELVQAVARSDMDPRHQHLDELVKDWTP